MHAIVRVCLALLINTRSFSNIFLRLKNRHIAGACVFDREPAIVNRELLANFENNNQSCTTKNLLPIDDYRLTITASQLSYSDFAAGSGEHQRIQAPVLRRRDYL